MVLNNRHLRIRFSGQDLYGVKGLTRIGCTFKGPLNHNQQKMQTLLGQTDNRMKVMTGW